jgi:surfeit locus 1 family protein
MWIRTEEISMHPTALVTLYWAGRTKYLTIAVIILAIGLGRLGVWQYQRHRERAAINDRIHAALAMQPVALAALLALPEADREYRPVRLTGIYEPHQVLWRNRVYNGGTGYHILSVLRSEAGGAVLVNRGWIPYEAGVGDEWQTTFAVPAGPQTIAAIWRVDQDVRANTPEASTTKWFTIDTTAIGAAMGISLVPGFAQIQPMGGKSRQEEPQQIGCSRRFFLIRQTLLDQHLLLYGKFHVSLPLPTRHHKFEHV